MDPDLIQRYGDDPAGLSDAELEALEAQIAQAEAREVLAGEVLMRHDLSLLLAADRQDFPAKVVEVLRAARRRRCWRIAAFAAAAVLALGLAIGLYGQVASRPGYTVSDRVGVCQVDGCPVQPGQVLAPATRLELATGATLACGDIHGTTLTLHGPGRARVGDDAQLAVEVGRCDVVVQKASAARFAIVTPHGRLSVRGTRFSVRVSPRESRVTVSEGAVQVAEPVGAGRLVATGETAAFGDRQLRLYLPCDSSEAAAMQLQGISLDESGAWRFTGTPARALGPRSAELGLADAMTLALWARFDQEALAGNTELWLASAGAGDGGFGWVLRVGEPADPRPRLAFVGAGGHRLDWLLPAIDAGWHHLAVVVDHGSARLFLDGVLGAASGGLGLAGPSGQRLVIGAKDEQGASAMRGLLDEIRVYSAALRDDEIAGLAEAR